MNDYHFIKHGLHLQGLPIYEADIPYIHNTLFIVKQTESYLNAFPDLNQAVPITMVDKEAIRCQN